MKLILLPLLASLPLITAVPAITTTENAILLIEKHLSTSEIQVKVLKVGSYEVLGHSCGGTLDAGSFKNYQIALKDLDKSGDGNIIIAGKTYLIHSDPKFSGGITCNRDFHDEGFQIQCEIPVPSALATQAKTSHCFQKRDLEQGYSWPSLSAGLEHEEEVYNFTSPKELDGQSGQKAKRQWECFAGYGTRRVGNGDPWQGYAIKQLSNTIGCGKAECSITLEETTSYNIGATATASWTQWISGGFSVDYSRATGQSEACSNTKANNQNLCVMSRIAHTSYKVRNYEDFICPDGITRWDRGNEFRIRSPNAWNAGGKLFCRVGNGCKWKSYYEWQGQYSHPGGPPS